MHIQKFDRDKINKIGWLAIKILHIFLFALIIDPFIQARLVPYSKYIYTYVHGTKV